MVQEINTIEIPTNSYKVHLDDNEDITHGPISTYQRISLDTQGSSQLNDYILKVLRENIFKLGKSDSLNENAEQRIKNPKEEILNFSFEQEYMKHPNYISNYQLSQDAIRGLIKEISKINYKDIAVELTPSNSIKFKVLLNEKVVVMITKPLDKLDNDADNNVIFSLFVDSKCLLTDVRSLYQALQGSEKLLVL